MKADKNGSEPCAVILVLCENPRRCLVDILVGARNDLENLGESILQLSFFDEVVNLRAERGCLVDQILVKLACLTL